jgi:hypothetical protein
LSCLVLDSPVGLVDSFFTENVSEEQGSQQFNSIQFGASN